MWCWIIGCLGKTWKAIWKETDGAFYYELWSKTERAGDQNKSYSLRSASLQEEENTLTKLQSVWIFLYDLHTTKTVTYLKMKEIHLADFVWKIKIILVEISKKIVIFYLHVRSQNSWTK